jgi:FdhD protein
MLARPPDAAPPVTRLASRIAVRSGETSSGSREVPEECAVALSYGGGTHAVMMATPADLEDFAVGFSLTEGIIERVSEIDSIAIVHAADGIDVQMWLAEPREAALAARRRHLAGPTGCGLCGVDSLAEAVRSAPAVGDTLRIDAETIVAAMRSLPPHQELHRRTAAVHAAAFWREGDGLVAVREDVGRHNALDKLVGTLARRGETAKGGILLLTSRVSVEMVQKAAVLGAEILVAVSAPTALAIRTAEAAGLTLAAIARRDGFEVFTAPRRISAS